MKFYSIQILVKTMGFFSGIISGSNIPCDKGITNKNTWFPIKLVKEKQNSNIYSFNLTATFVDDCKSEGNNCMVRNQAIFDVYFIITFRALNN